MFHNNRNNKKQRDNKSLMIWSLAGGVLGAAALFMTKRPGREIKGNIKRMYRNASHALTGHKEEMYINNDLLLYGSIAGGVLAALSGLYFTPKTRRYIGSKIKNQYTTASSLLDTRKNPMKRLVGGLKRSPSRRKKQMATKRK